MTTPFANFYGCLAILIWSFCPLAALFLNRLPVFEVSALTLCLSGALSGIIVALKKERVSSKCRADQFILSAILLFINHISYLLAFHYIPPEVAELCYYTWPFFLLLQLSFFLHRSFHMVHLLSLTLGFAALCFLMPPSATTFTPRFSFGLFLALTAAFCWSSYQTLSLRQRDYPPEIIGLQCGVAGLVALFLHMSAETFIAPNFTEWVALSCIGFGAIGCALYFWRMAIRKGNIYLLSTLSFFIPIL
ncbi:MAG: DMT family transporter, partial [Chlamydiia bacterium]|nr:DMT family transporter [Chlamydiia bacterium]